MTVVEFAGYQCPFCKSFFSTTLPTLKKEYIDTGKVRLVMKDLASAYAFEREAGGARSPVCDRARKVLTYA